MDDVADGELPPPSPADLPLTALSGDPEVNARMSSLVSRLAGEPLAEDPALQEHFADEQVDSAMAQVVAQIVNPGRIQDDEVDEAMSEVLDRVVTSVVIPSEYLVAEDDPMADADEPADASTTSASDAELLHTLSDQLGTAPKRTVATPGAPFSAPTRGSSRGPASFATPSLRPKTSGSVAPSERSVPGPATEDADTVPHIFPSRPPAVADDFGATVDPFHRSQGPKVDESDRVGTDGNTRSFSGADAWQALARPSAERDIDLPDHDLPGTENGLVDAETIDPAPAVDPPAPSGVEPAPADRSTGQQPEAIDESWPFDERPSQWPRYALITLLLVLCIGFGALVVIGALSRIALVFAG